MSNQRISELGVSRQLRVSLDSIQVAVDLLPCTQVVTRAIAIHVRVGTQGNPIPNPILQLTCVTGPPHGKLNSKATLTVPLNGSSCKASLHASVRSLIKA